MRAAFRPVAAGPDLLYSDGGTAAPRSTSEKNTKRTQFLTTNPESMGYDWFSSTAGPPAQRDPDRSLRRDTRRLRPESRSAGLGGRCAETCGRWPILKGGTAASEHHGRRSRTKYETNPISHNERGINGLRRVFQPVAHGSAVVLPRLAAVGYNGNAARTLSVGPGRDKQSCLSSRRQAAR